MSGGFTRGLAKLLGAKFLEIAAFEVKTFYYESQRDASDEFPRFEVVMKECAKGVNLPEILYLAATGMAEFSFYRLREQWFDRGLALWRTALREQNTQPTSFPDSQVPAATATARLQIGRVPFVVLDVAIGPVKLHDLQLVPDLALAFFRWAWPQLSPPWQQRLRETMAYAVEKWRTEPPRSDRNTWDWRLWIDYPACVERVLGPYNAGGLPLPYNYQPWSDSSVGVSLDVPTFLRPRTGQVDKYSAVFLEHKPGTPMFQIYQDSGLRLSAIHPGMDGRAYLEALFHAQQAKSAQDGGSCEWVAPPRQVLFKQRTGWQAEYLTRQGTSVELHVIEAASRLNASTMAGINTWTQPPAVWMHRDMLDRIRSSLEFL